VSARELGQTLTRSLKAGARALAVLTEEEERAVRVLEEIGDALDWPVHVWSPAAGIDQGGEVSLEQVLRTLTRSKSDALWVLLDPRRSVTPAALRLVRDLGQRTTGPAIVILSPALDSTLDLPELVVEALTLPDVEELRERIEWIGDQLEVAGHDGAAARLAEHAPALARASLGLPLLAVERLFAEAILDHGAEPDAIAAWIARHKPHALDRRGLLEHVEAAPLGELGGLEGYKGWLAHRRHALEPSARAAGIPAPRGVVLVGVQGCGKSLAARATADALDLPLLRLEPGRLFGGTVGESEANLRTTLAIVDRMAPVVLWLDEIEKGLAGADGSASDAGTTARVVGGLLTWLQERTRPVFVVATANDVQRLPPELLRRGRLDEVFFVDLPDADERETILDVHLRRRPERELGRVPALADSFETFSPVARDADGYSGAEIEAAVVEARLHAFADGRPLAADDLRAALEATVPLSRSHAEGLQCLRAWAETRARPAAGDAPPKDDAK
jgi:MoxR-like ATPase